jgi:GGDEF domain-containing protein
MGPPFPLQGHQVQVGASVGVTVSQAADVDAVLREADVAMYTAKAPRQGPLRDGRHLGLHDLTAARAVGWLDRVDTIRET